MSAHKPDTPNYWIEVRSEQLPPDAGSGFDFTTSPQAIRLVRVTGDAEGRGPSLTDELRRMGVDQRFLDVLEWTGPLFGAGNGTNEEHGHISSITIWTRGEAIVPDTIP